MLMKQLHAYHLGKNSFLSAELKHADESLLQISKFYKCMLITLMNQFTIYCTRQQL